MPLLRLCRIAASGMVLIVGCSHPGIEAIVGAAAKIDPRIDIVFGGFHLPTTSDAEIERIGRTLYDVYHVRYLAPGHCTGEPAFAAFRRVWGEAYRYAGLGTVIAIP